MTSWPRFTDTRLFVTEAVRGFRITGAVAPSSRRLAAALCAPAAERAGQPLDVLEVGAGTGPVTRFLLPLLAPGSSLDVVEANPRFAAVLRNIVHEGQPDSGGFATPSPSRSRPRVRRPDRLRSPVRAQVHETPVEHLDTRKSYDVIVSGLPFTNFAPDLVASLMDRYLELLRPGGSLTYFAYVGTARARRLVAPAAEVARHRAVEAVLAECRLRGASEGHTVWANIPPARVWRLYSTPSPAHTPAAQNERSAAARPGAG
ncbi:class I SAM-dependent methyltransferase [Streptomyces sp. NPDC088146]|uniref:class I SAM-dependent methyltransferase n=1 Tax=Streptomyces sp. NPDC088146 TaxID=3365829 RepID=UPI0038274FC6